MVIFLVVTIAFPKNLHLPGGDEAMQAFLAPGDGRCGVWLQNCGCQWVWGGPGEVMFGPG